MDWITNPEIWVSLLSLTALEIVLGIDNVVFLTIIAGKLPKGQQPKARQYGLALALITRILLLLSISWIIGLTEPLHFFGQFNLHITGRSIILFAGGAFLIAKSTLEIHQKLEGEEGHASEKIQPKFWNVILQIAILDLVFSLDSVITAVGMVDPELVLVMIAAVIIAMIVMIFSVNSISDFVENHPTVKILALSFLIMIGFSLVAESFEVAIPKGYIYFAMGFSVFVEILNLRFRNKKRKPVALRDSYTENND